ncbi:unnamed protein product [Rotaria socialis]|uniref:Uncharacterized protein n=1 Tax=Rotaria socialis TaxID=392032 RepID=A0A818V8J1_9BILA|nr:unnamed protein product [Rotaria socialis]CAF3432035.1 unnamed protein product [Rotaria socialis]CAF3584605.1 unnamed protein product [Rotaria socialis]CAF3709003.1 unnamed protein product [Rotaria socialis]CAF4315159.1 unnamed protein product [Rotaria socialis]
MMFNPIRSNSYSESVKQNLDPLATTPIAKTRRSVITDSVNRTSTYNDVSIDLSSNQQRCQSQDCIIDMHLKKRSTLPKVKPPREVSLRVKFIRLGEVNTLHEKFYAEVVIEARWLYDPDATAWNPNLYVKNALGDVKQEISSELVNNLDEPVYADTNDNDIFYVWEIRKVSGTFWEKLELNSFPADVQQLSLQIVTRCPIEECILIENRLQPSMVNREAFLAQQEWFLYEHIETRSTITTEDFSFRPIRQSTYSVTCCVARRPGYFYWNVYLLIFLITLIALTVYGVAPEHPHSRLQITGTLLLTSIMFRWSVSRLLPPVSYLTLLDKYTLMSLVFISMNSIWHSIIGFLIRNMGISKMIDYYVLIVFTAFFIIYHCLTAFILYRALRNRQIMLESDRKYALKLSGTFETFAQRHNDVQRFEDRQTSSHTSLFI